MPTYDYRCKQCGKTHEITQGFNDLRPTTCPSCGGQLVRVFHPVGVVFKGSGFHKTDYSGTGRKPEPGGNADSGAPSSGTTDGAPASKPAESAKTESKPAAPAAAPPKSDSKPTGSD
jgi:putative FmdB family regulatory protein